MKGLKAGFQFPRGPEVYAPRFCCGHLDFLDEGPKIVCLLNNNQKSCLWPLIFIIRPFRAPSLIFKTQILKRVVVLPVACVLILSLGTVTVQAWWSPVYRRK